YGDADPAFTFQTTSLIGSDTLTGVSCGVSGAHTNAGSYPITCSGNTNTNYNASYVAGTLTVNARAATVTADNKSKTYGDPDPSFTFQTSGLVGSDSLTGVSCTVSGAHVNVGSYPISCSGNTNTNYNVTYNSGTLTINARPATVTA